jgi:lipoprotein-anchoring transpeptidase ErfK/SrfK
MMRVGERASLQDFILGQNTMRLSVIAFVFGLGFLCAAQSAMASVVIYVSKSSQSMSVFVEGSHAYSWPISSGRRGYSTPAGSYRPTFLSRFHRSSRYYGSPMPHSIFFHRGYAIHGSYETGRLGSPASHGCIRLHPYHARTLYGLVQGYGRGATRIVIRN